jgi:sugar phosphate isomerase/epimerase
LFACTQFLQEWEKEGKRYNPMMQRFRIGAITDEFSPDLEVALKSMAEVGMEAAELRLVFGKNIIDLSDEEVARAVHLCEKYRMKIVSIASPLLKCTMPDAPPIDERFQQDMFASKHTFEDQPRLAERAFQIAKTAGAKIIRVFSYWRVVEPEAVFDRVVDALRALAAKAAEHDLIIGLENEHACNIATAAESARALAALSDVRNIELVWDPANAYISGEIPYPAGYEQLPAGRIGHVHAKDCKLDGHKPIWGPLGEQDVDWRGQIGALERDGYTGYINLETHWLGPNGDKHLASMICGENLLKLVSD